MKFLRWMLRETLVGAVFHALACRLTEERRPAEVVSGKRV